MSLFDCIGRALDDPETGADPKTRERLEEAQRLFNELRGRYAREFGEGAADAMAAADVKRILRKRGQRAKRVALMQLQAARRLTRNVLTYRTTRGEMDPGEALPALLESDHVADFDSVESQRKSLQGFYHGMMADVLRTFGRDILGRSRGKALMPDFLRALHGETKRADGTALEPAALELAQAAQAATKRAREDYNAAGGDIGELADWGLPHHHNAEAIRAAKFHAWAADIRPRLDWSRIEDSAAERPFARPGEVPSAERVHDFLTRVYKQITTSGWATREPSFQRPGLSVANRRGHARVLHFKNADEWMTYNEQFGDADPYAALIAHLSGMARDTAMMRVLGPNPMSGLEFAIQVAEKHAMTRFEPAGRWDRDARDRVEKRAVKARAMLGLISGSANRPVDHMLAGFLAGTRQVLTAAQLGGAMLSAVSDAGFQYMAARQIGMDPFRVVGRMAKQLRSEDARMQALRMGVIADRLANVGSATARYLGEAWAPEMAERLSEFTMRASGLTAWTEAGRHAFQLEFMGFLADNVDRGFADLPNPLRALFERRGITPERWDQIRAFDLHTDPEGATFLVPHIMRQQAGVDAETADFLASRLMSIISEQTEFAVPSATVRGRAFLGGDARPGTFAGELLRSGLMYKSFALSVMFNQARRFMQQDGRWSKLRYAAQMSAMLGIMGGVSVQLKEVAKGRDPRPMGTKEFMAAAVLQGGGLGIFGDFFAAESNRFGGGIEQTLAGPVSGAAGDAIGLMLEAGRFAASAGEEGRPWRRLVTAARQYTPGASLWYANLAVQRLVFDELQRWGDPEAESAFRRAEQRQRRNYGNASWWRRGERAPDRGPDLAGAL